MAKKKVELFIDINTEKEFDTALNHNKNKMIYSTEAVKLIPFRFLKRGAEIYSGFVGSCTALDRLFTLFKFDWGAGCVVLLKILCDEIEVFKRFRNQSEPVYIFIVNRKATKVFRGVNSMKLSDIMLQELKYFKAETLESGPDISGRTYYELDQPTPDEMNWIKSREVEALEEASRFQQRHDARQAERKRHRAELMVPYIPHLNFVLFWPHSRHAHPELYERWDANNIIMVGREELELTEDLARDILYAGDAPLNESSLQALLAAPALAICFRFLDDDQHFASLVRKILYEEIPPLDETKPSRDQPPQKTAFNLYKSYSLTRPEIYKKRREDKIKRREAVLESRARRLSEMQRLARLAIQETLEIRKKAKEDLKIELLKTGKIAELEKLKSEPDDEEVDIVIPEELSDEYHESSSEEEDENEHFPPAGQLIPGFYAPPNDIAKANGLAILFPNIIMEYVTPQPEFLPPHVLVLLSIHKRHKAIEALMKYKSAVIHMGIFKCATPYNAVHVAYSVKEYDAMVSKPSQDDLRVAFMLSVKVDYPVLALMELSPPHVSADPQAGEDDCAALFPVHYADDERDHEDFIQEEE